MAKSLFFFAIVLLGIYFGTVELLGTTLQCYRQEKDKVQTPKNCSSGEQCASVKDKAGKVTKDCATTEMCKKEKNVTILDVTGTIKCCKKDLCNSGHSVTNGHFTVIIAVSACLSFFLTSL
uniref:Leukocyte membrane protein 1 n=1 Tax=Eptatretus stoutii TaxID=7765 RepID=Q9UAD1_EPTST|nr:leukocyte membrane protein 1 [Eptatretus stoutii]